MAKQRPSLEAFIVPSKPSAPQAVSADLTPAPAPIEAKTEPAKVVEFPQQEAQAKGKRESRPHTTLYLDKRVQKAIKEIALQYDRKPHDLYLEGIDLMLTHYGRPSIKDLSK